MIPKGSTPIKNEILIDILAKGLLSKDEIRIVAYIIRWSWGFVGKNKRQDWTKPLQQKKIAEDIEMQKSHLNRNLKKMIAENKILEKDGCYQFNEHYNQWIKVTKKSTEKADKKLPNSQPKLPKSQPEITKMVTKVTKMVTETPLKGNKGNGLPKFKETYKETLKETIKEKGSVFSEILKEFIKHRDKNKKKMTDYAVYLKIQKLNKMTDDVNEQIEILKQSIEKGWQDVYPLKDNQKGGSNGNSRKLQQQPKTESEYDHLCKVYRNDT